MPRTSICIAALALLAGCASPPAAPQRAISAPVTAPQATLVFTATDLRKDYRGENLGTGSLLLYPPGGQCASPPRTLTKTENVTADQPTVSVTIPAERSMVVSSFWSAGAAHCVLGNYSFTAQRDRVYKLTNVQNISGGSCTLKLQRLSDDRSKYVEDYSLRPAARGCQRAAR